MSLYKADDGSVHLSERDNSPKVTPLPFGRLRVERRFDIQHHEDVWHASFNTDGEPEDLTIKVFGGYGLLDGTNVEQLPNPENWSTAYKEQAFKDCRLIDEIADPGQDNKWILTQIYETLTDTWEKEDKDKFQAMENGLLLMTRSQVAKRNTDPPYRSTDIGTENIERFTAKGGYEGVFIRQPHPNFGTPDTLVSEDDYILQESNEGAGDWIILQPSGLPPFWEKDTASASPVGDYTDPNGIGDPITVTESTVILSGIEDQSTDRMGRFVTRWSEPGVLNDSSDSRYDNTVTIREVTAIAMTSAQVKAQLGLVSDPTDESITEYEGLRTRTFRFVSGSGEISRTITTKNALTTTVVVTINETPVGPPDSVLVSAETRFRDFGILYTYRYVSGQGEISRDVDQRYNGALTITTVSTVNEPPVPPAGAALVSSDIDVRDGYTIYTKQYAQGSGEISRSSDTRHNGSLVVTTVTSINEPPQADGAVIESKVDARDGFILYTYQFAAGQGEIARTTDSRFNGTLTFVTVTSINEKPDAGGALIESRVESRDGWLVYTYQFVSGSGEISRSNDERFNGALTVTTITSINQKPEGPGALINTQVESREAWLLYTYQFASGQGEIERTEDTRFNGALTLTTIRSLNQKPTGPGALVSQEVQDRDGYEIYTYQFAEGEGEIERTIDSRYSGLIKIITVRSVNEKPNEPYPLLETAVEDRNGYQIYTYRYAKIAQSGKEIIVSREKRNDGKLTITRKVAINQSPSGSGKLIKETSREEDGYTVFESVFAEGEGEIGRDVSSGPTNIPGTTRVTVRSIGSPIPESGELIDERDIARDGYTEYHRTFLQGGITGVKATYDDIVQVEVPGEVECVEETFTLQRSEFAGPGTTAINGDSENSPGDTTLQSGSGGTIQGVVAVPKVTPRRRKQVKATVEIGVYKEGAIPQVGQRAYDLGEISCSVLTKKESVTLGEGKTISDITDASGFDIETTDYVGYSQSVNVSARIQTYPGCWLKKEKSEGTIQYTARKTPYWDSGSVQFRETTVEQKTACIGTGSTEKEGYHEQGELKRRARPILTNRDGEIFYEVIIWKV